MIRWYLPNVSSLRIKLFPTKNDGQQDKTKMIEEREKQHEANL